VKRRSGWVRERSRAALHAALQNALVNRGPPFYVSGGETKPMIRSTPTRIFLLALALGLAACGGDDDSSPAGPNPTFFADRVLNIAHRGGNRLRPEQTILAWESALELGVDVLEMDFRATSDGVLVMMHDQTVDRTTDGTGFVNQLTFAEIRALDAGYDFTPDGGATYPYRGQGVQVPTLEEVLARFPGVPMNIEIKAENPPTVIEPFVELLDRYRMRPHVLVASFSDTLLFSFRAAAPDVLTSLSPLEVAQLLVLTPEQEALYSPPALFAQVPPFSGTTRVLSADFVAKAHRVGLLVHAWDVDDQMQETIDLGVDGLIVDDPETLAGLL